MPRIARDQDPCPYTSATHALKHIGGRWRLLVIKRLLDEGPQRYRQLHRALPPSLSDKMLAQVLRELVDHGLVWRQERDPSPPKTVVYGLTALGAGARPVVDALTRWGAQLRPLRGNAEG